MQLRMRAKLYKQSKLAAYFAVNILWNTWAHQNYANYFLWWLLQLQMDQGHRESRVTRFPPEISGNFARSYFFKIFLSEAV